jgi:hypothetical protein
VEEAIMTQLRAIFRMPDVIARTYRAAIEVEKNDPELFGQAPQENDVVKALLNIDPVWDALFPREQERIVSGVVDRKEYAGLLEALCRGRVLDELRARLHAYQPGARGEDAHRIGRDVRRTLGPTRDRRFRGAGNQSGPGEHRDEQQRAFPATTG